MCHADTGQAAIWIRNREFRKLDARSWDVRARCADMDRDLIAMQVLSPMPELLSSWFDPADTAVMADHVNGGIAGMVADAPRRFAGLGMVPMQDMPSAITGLRRVRETFGLRGVEIGTHVNGTLLGHASLNPFWEAAEAMGMAIFVHPLHPVTTRGLEAPPLLAPLAGFPLDTGLAAASLLMAGIFDRHPGLRIGLSHGGGALAPVLYRLDYAFASMPSFSATLARSPGEAAKNFFLDTNVYDPAYLFYLATRLSPGRVFLGTDYPYEIMQKDPRTYVNAAGLDEASQHSLQCGAACSFLGIDDSDIGSAVP